MQTKKQSHREAATGTVISFVVGVTGNLILLPIINEYPVVIAAPILTTVFMLLSYARQYLLRRFFNWYDHAQMEPRKWRSF